MCRFFFLVRTALGFRLNLNPHPPLATYESETPMENAAGIEQDPDLWFSDGSIIVIAEDTGFRVHMSLLSRSSPILRDVFTLPQPVAGTTSLDGNNVFLDTPVVHVSDSAYDMRCLLHTIYDGRKYVPLFSPFVVLSSQAHRFLL